MPGWNNRKILTQLFQGYVKDYGDEVGWRIITFIIEELGGLRVTVPKNEGSRTDENIFYLKCLRERMHCEFGNASGDAIMEKFATHLKGEKIWIPNMRYLFQEERRRKIREKYNGKNINELALRYDMSPAGVKKILKDD